MENVISTISNEINEVLNNVDTLQAIKLSENIKNAKRIFISGTGRSGLVGKMFGMRLMHIGFNVFIVGETITPSIEKDDLVILISGSGSTDSQKQFGIKAKDIDAKVALITTNKESIIGKISDSILIIPAATKKRLSKEPETIQPLGSQFDQSAHLLLDSIIVYLLKDAENKDNDSLVNKHANLE